MAGVSGLQGVQGGVMERLAPDFLNGSGALKTDGALSAKEGALAAKLGEQDQQMIARQFKGLGLGARVNLLA